MFGSVTLICGEEGIVINKQSPCDIQERNQKVVRPQRALAQSEYLYLVASQVICRV